MDFDVAVIGGGPGGYYAAIRAAQQGAKTVIFEYDRFGGTCLNVGCIPTKCLLDKAELIHTLKEYTEYGIFKDAGLFSWKKIMAFKNEIVLKLTNGVETLLESYGVEIVKAKAFLEKNNSIRCEETNKTYHAKNIILATGSKSINPPIDGINGVNVIDSTGALNLKNLPKSFVIIGGGIIGLEFASLYATMGSKVTVIEMLDEILPSEDKDGINLIINKLKKQNADIITGATVLSIKDVNGKTVNYRKGEQTAFVSAEYVIKAVGRSANKEGIDVKLLGLKTDIKGNIIVNTKMQTNLDGVYAVGDVAGGYQLAHSAYAEAETAVKNCIGINSHVNLSIMPRCIYMLPQYAAVGLTEDQLKEKGITYKKGIFPYAANGKSLAQNEKEGFSKVMTDVKTGVVLGAVIAGHNATELLSSMVTAMNGAMTIIAIQEAIFPHPTMSEIIKETGAAVSKSSVHLSNTNIK